MRDITYHEYNDDEERNWDDDVDDVEAWFSVQVNGEIDLRIRDHFVANDDVDPITPYARSNQLPYVYKANA